MTGRTVSEQRAAVGLVPLGTVTTEVSHVHGYTVTRRGAEVLEVRDLSGVILPPVWPPVGLVPVELADAGAARWRLLTWLVRTAQAPLVAVGAWLQELEREEAAKLLWLCPRCGHDRRRVYATQGMMAGACPRLSCGCWDHGAKARPVPNAVLAWWGLPTVRESSPTKEVPCTS